MRAQVDYLTVTFRQPPFVYIGEDVSIGNYRLWRDAVVKVSDWRLTSYTGEQWVVGSDGQEVGSFMHGFSASEKGRPYITNVTSGLANEMFLSVCGEAVSQRNGNARLDFQESIVAQCTRLDVKVDVVTGERFDAVRAYDDITKAYNDGIYPGRLPKLIVYRSSTGDTLYIGAETSDKRARIYQKDGIVRHEIQARNGSQSRYAADAFNHLCACGSPDDVYNALRWPFMPECDGVAMPVKRTTRENDTAGWLNTSVRNSISRMGKDWTREYLWLLIRDYEENHDCEWET